MRAARFFITKWLYKFFNAFRDISLFDFWRNNSIVSQWFLIRENHKYSYSISSWVIRSIWYYQLNFSPIHWQIKQAVLILTVTLASWIFCLLTNYIYRVTRKVYNKWKRVFHHKYDWHRPLFFFCCKALSSPLLLR